MSESTTPQQEVRKRLSGMLIFSVFLSISGYLIVPVLGPIVGGVLAFVGRKRVRENPLLIGPRFAAACMMIAAVSVVLQGIQLYKAYPRIQLQRELSSVGSGFFAALSDRDYEKVYELMSSEYRQARSLEDVRTMLAAAFPGEDKIPHEEGHISVPDDKKVAEDLSERVERFFEEQQPELEIVVPYRWKHEGANVDLDLGLLVTRGEGRADFVVAISNLTAERREESESGEKPAETPAEEPGDGR
jgi:hypothetical protein